MFLTATDQKIEAVLSGAVAANQVQFVAAYADITTTTFVPGESDGITSDTTDVDVVPAPASSTQRQIKSLSFYNADTAAVELTVKLSNGGTERVLVKATLAAAVTLVWTPEHGWQKGVIGSHSFIDLPDTPGSYSGNASLVPSVNSGETALEFVTVANSVFGRTGAVTAQSGDYNAGQIDETSSAKIMTTSERIKLAGIESGAEVNDVDSVFGRTGAVTAQSGDYSFLQLGDTPGNYTGDANKVPQVNSGETALEFTDTLLMGDGTAAAPAYSFAADPDTGMRRPAANTLAWSFGGVEGFRAVGESLRVGTAEDANTVFAGTSEGGVLEGDRLAIASDGLSSIFLNRIGTDGQTVRFLRDGVQVGGILTGNDGRLVLQADPANTQVSSYLSFEIDNAEVGRFSVNSSLLLSDGTNTNPGMAFLNDPNTGFARPGADEIDVVIGGSNVIRFLSSGFYVGTTSATTSDVGVQCQPQGGVFVTRDSNYPFQLRRNTDTGSLARFLSDGTVVGTISTDGASTSYNTSSDHRLKEQVIPMSGAAGRINQLNPVRFKFVGEPGIKDGFLAHEVAGVIPEAVQGEKDAVDEEGNIIPQSMDYSKLTPLLTAATQENTASIESNATAIQELESRIAQLENSNAARQ